MSGSERHEPWYQRSRRRLRARFGSAGLEGSLDAVKGWTVYGWAMDGARPDEAVEVEIYDNLHQVGTVSADLFRHDLRQEGKGNGEHGFAFNLANVFDPARSSILFSGERHSISAKVAGTDFLLPGSPIQIEPSPPEPGKRETRGKFCTMPFEKFVIDAGGSVFLCCPSYLPVPVGNAYQQDFEEIWNSNAAKELRRSIVDGDFRHCLDVCPAIQQGLLPDIASIDSPRYEAALGSRDFSLSTGPTHLSLLHDRTCNLSCPSCRTEVLVALGREKQRLQSALANVIRPMLGSVETLEFAGGELFASKHLREVLAAIDREENPDLRIAYFSNGTLFNEEEWAKISNVHGMFKLIYVSMDAARSDTFRELRRGATLEQVLPCLEFIAKLRRQGEVEEFGLLFVVQERNFEEMKEFVELAMGLGCDTVKFHRIMDFGTYPPGEFQRRDICAGHHPRNEELVELLKDPVFAEPIVDLGNLFDLYQQARLNEAVSS